MNPGMCSVSMYLAVFVATSPLGLNQIGPPVKYVDAQVVRSTKLGVFMIGNLEGFSVSKMREESSENRASS